MWPLVFSSAKLVLRAYMCAVFLFCFVLLVNLVNVGTMFPSAPFRYDSSLKLAQGGLSRRIGRQSKAVAVIF